MRFKTEPNEMAFPIKDEQSGLTKREYFAGLAMQGILANEEQRINLLNDAKTAQKNKEWNHEVFLLYIADEAVLQADCLINALNKEQGNDKH